MTQNIDSTDEGSPIGEAWEIVRSEWQKRTALGKVVFPMWLFESAVWWSFIVFLLVVAHVYDLFRDRPTTGGVQIYADEEDGD